MSGNAVASEITVNAPFDLRDRPTEILQCVLLRLDTSGIQKFVCRDLAHPAQYRRATSVTHSNHRTGGRLTKDRTSTKRVSGYCIDAKMRVIQHVSGSVWGAAASPVMRRGAALANGCGVFCGLKKWLHCCFNCNDQDQIFANRRPIWLREN
jgi:hypothetical protein